MQDIWIKAADRLRFDAYYRQLQSEQNVREGNAAFDLPTVGGAVHTGDEAWIKLYGVAQAAVDGLLAQGIASRTDL